MFMNKRTVIKKLFKPIFMVAFGSIIIYFSLPILIQYKSLGISNSKLNLWLLMISIAAYSTGHLIRALRLYVLLGSSEIGLKSVINTHLQSNSVNIILPFKLGEFARIYLLSKKHCSVVRATYVLIVERFFDLLAMVLIGSFLSLFFEEVLDKLGFFYMGFLIFLLLVSSLLLGSHSLLLLLHKTYLKRVNLAPGTTQFVSLITHAYSLLESIFLIVRTKKVLLGLMSIWVWIFEILAFMFFLPVFDYNFLQVFSAALASFLGFLAPSGPASLGSQQLFVNFFTTPSALLMQYLLIYQVFILCVAGVLPGAILYISQKLREYRRDG